MSYRMPWPALAISLFFLGCASRNAGDSGRGPDFYRGRSATVSSAAYWKVTSCQEPADCGKAKAGSRWTCVNTSCLAVPATGAEPASPSALASHAVDEAQPAEPTAENGEPPPPLAPAEPPAATPSPAEPTATPAPITPAPAMPAAAETAPNEPAPVEPR
jgi:hypothetical protein